MRLTLLSQGGLRLLLLREGEAVRLADADLALRLARAAAALAFARRKRFGPWSGVAADRALREKQIAAMVRGGHGFALARAIVELPPGADPRDALMAFGLETPPC